MHWNYYHIAESVADALVALRNSPGTALPVGGGTDLLLEIQQGHHPPVDTLVDLTRIPELGLLELRGEWLFIGAGVPVSRVAEHLLVRTHARAVSEACALIGGPQVRNSATLGGNVAHALPAADGMIALTAMDAEVVIASADGVRTAPILTLFKGPGQSTLDLRREFLIGFNIQTCQSSETSAFSRIMRPQGVALPVMNMAMWLCRNGDRINGARIAVGPAGPTPQRARVIEDYLIGRACSAVDFGEVDGLWHEHMRFRSSPQRASAAYRYHLSGVLFKEVFEKCLRRAQSADGD